MTFGIFIALCGAFAHTPSAEQQELENRLEDLRLARWEMLEQLHQSSRNEPRLVLLDGR